MTNPRLRSAIMRPSGNKFDILPGKSILESGLSAGIALPFGCANGSCGECRARAVSGKVRKIQSHDYTLTNSQKIDGQCLLCSFTAETDIELEVYEAQSIADIPQQTLKAKCCRHTTINNVHIVALKFIRGKALRFLPGQSILLEHSDGTATQLPIASCPCNAGIVEFHLFDSSDPHDNAAQLNTKVLNTLASQKHIVVSGPVGNFTVSKSTPKPKIFYANGGEFAQVQGMIEHVLNSDLDVPCCLIWRATDDVEHYQLNLCRSWHDAFDEFTLFAVRDGAISALFETTAWQELVTQSEAYLGSKRDSTIEELLALGVSESCIFYPQHSVEPPLI